MDAFIPSLIPIDVRSGEFQPSRFARSVISSLDLNEELNISEKDYRGLERDLSEELFRAFSGITESEGTLDKNLTFKGYEFASGRSATSSKFNRELRKPNTTRQDLLNTFIEANEDRFRVYNKFYAIINDYRTLGFSDAKIRKILKDANVSGYKELMQGRYPPLPFPKGDKLRDMRENGTLDLLPRQEIMSYIQGQRDRKYGESFTPNISDQTPSINFNDLIPDQQTPSINFDDLIPDQSSIPAPRTVNMNLASMNVQPGPVDPNLLGNNPLNIALAQRLGRI